MTSQGPPPASPSAAVATPSQPSTPASAIITAEVVQQAAAQTSILNQSAAVSSIAMDISGSSASELSKGTEDKDSHKFTWKKNPDAVMELLKQSILHNPFNLEDGQTAKACYEKISIKLQSKGWEVVTPKSCRECLLRVLKKHAASDHTTNPPNQRTFMLDVLLDAQISQFNVKQTKREERMLKKEKSSGKTPGKTSSKTGILGMKRKRFGPSGAGSSSLAGQNMANYTAVMDTMIRTMESLLYYLKERDERAAKMEEAKEEARAKQREAQLNFHDAQTRLLLALATRLTQNESQK